jgi:hypothetical protein
MKTTPSHLKATLLRLLSVLCAPVIIHAEVSQQSTASTAGIAIDRTQYFTQSSASAPAEQTMPFSLNFNIRGSSQNMSAWGPAFYKPGSGGVPQTGSSSATNTGTLNFSPTPNNGYGGYMFSHEFATNADLVATYPLGAYGVKFQGSGAPTPNTFTAGIVFAASGPTYPSVTPQIASANNGATWSDGVLKINSSGVTTLTLNAFPEYSSSTYGSVITAGIYSPGGNVVASASVEAYYLPTLGVNQPPVTQLTLDGSWLTPGVTYTIEIQYVVIASAPVEGYLNGENFQGVASYVKNTSISVSSNAAVSSSPSRYGDFNGDGQDDMVWRNTQTGEYAFWLMNGMEVVSGLNKGVMPLEWQIVGKGDFNSDGKSDLIWRNTQTGEFVFWLMNGTDVETRVSMGTAPLEWQIAGTGDFNGDGHSDLLWRNTQTGDYAFWLMNGTEVVTALNKGAMPLEWQITGTGDFNADGKCDIIWRNTQTGDYAFWLMNGTEVVTGLNKGAMPLEWQITSTGDFNADGQCDIVWRNTQTGDYAFWLMNGMDVVTGLNKGAAPLEWQIVR